MRWRLQAGERMVSARNDGLEFSTPTLGAAEPMWRTLVSPADYARMNASSWAVSHSGEFVLFASNSHALYRHSRFSEYVFKTKHDDFILTVLCR